MADEPVRVLVVYASENGSTKEIAEFVAAGLRAHAMTVEVRSARERPDVSGFDGVVLGSAVHNRAVLPAAERFARDNLDALRARPLWLFSVGMGPALHGPIGRLLRDAVPGRIAHLRDALAPTEYHAFAGVVPRAAFPPLSRVLLRLFGGRYGDLRDWRAISGWADGIARQLHATTPAA